MHESFSVNRSSLFGVSRLRVILHLITWLVVILVPLYFMQRFKISSGFIWFLYFNLMVNGLVFYVNYLFLVPKYYFSARKMRYLMALVSFLVVLFFGSYYGNVAAYNSLKKSGQIERMDREINAGRKPGQPDPPKFSEGPVKINEHLVRYLGSSIFLAFFSLGIRTIERNTKIEKEQKELQQEKLSAELALLKHQISPHFLFNTLNNIYSLSTFSPEDSQTAILKLSKMMRYLLYETEDNSTKLSDEIDLLKNYIDLMKLRLDEGFNLKVSLPENYTDVMMPPLLFIPFIENAFKHGISFRGESFIDISLEKQGNTVFFNSRNSISAATDNTGLEPSGIGLSNVGKRLELLFPGKYSLDINNDGRIFDVKLAINI